MKNTKESVYIFSVPIDKIKEHIMCRSMAKIKGIITKTNKIREMNYEFARQMNISTAPKQMRSKKKKRKKLTIFNGR